MRHIATRAFMVLGMAAAVFASTASLAFAAGDPAVDNLIVKNALPGWTVLPAAALEGTVESERSALGATTDRNFQVAVEGWRQGRQPLVAILISFPNHDVPGDFKTRDAVVGACGAATRSDPRSMHSFSGIAGSTEGRCVGTAAGGIAIDAVVMAWQKENMVALVIGSQTTQAAVESYAVTQDAALPGPVSGSADDSSSNTTAVLVIIAIIIAIIIVLGVAIGFLLIARSKSKLPLPVQALGGSPRTSPAGWGSSPPASDWGSPAPTSTWVPPAQSPGFGAPTPTPFAAPAATVAQEPGWQPIEGDPTRIAYWDGARFTAWKRWDGSSWVD